MYVIFEQVFICSIFYYFKIYILKLIILSIVTVAFSIVGDLVESLFNECKALKKR